MPKFEPQSEKNERVFDYESFWKDVQLYRERHHLHVTDMTDMMDIDESHFRQAYKYKMVVGLSYVFRLAKLCDLDLNKYNIAEVVS